MEKVRKNKNKA